MSPPLYVESHGTGRPILLVHGFGATAYTWRHLVPLLARRHEAITVDLKGSGRAQKPPDGHFGVRDQADYQRLSFGLPFVGDRHYVIRVAERRYRGTDGRLSYAFIWRLEDGLPHGVDPDAVRVSVNSGYWDLRPAKDSDSSTDVRYCVFTDPAGALPKWLVGMANTEAIPKLFAAVASEARSPRYATLAPPPEEGATTERPTLGGCADMTSSAR